MNSPRKILYFNCQSGISGDMTVAALLDLGLDQNEFKRRLGSLNLEGYRVEIGRRDSSGIDACDFDVIQTKEEHAHRHLSDIEAIIRGSDLPERVQDTSMKIFTRLAAAEAKVHGSSIEEVHFHEVGAIDSIVDIVSASICLQMIDADEIVCSPIPVGTGFVKCAHGLLPVPAPATAELLKGAPVYQSDIEGEIVTPTGAAIIQTMGDRFGPMPPIELEATGYGAGKKQFERPNILRVFAGAEVAAEDAKAEIADAGAHPGSHEAEDLLLLETNIDDMNPEIYSYLFPKLLDNGALDVYLTNVLMKKGRPGALLTVLCGPELAGKLGEILFAETTTLGIRRRAVSRFCLERRASMVETRFGKVQTKEMLRHGKLIRRMCEYEECRRIASESGLPLREVYEMVGRDIEVPRDGER